MSWKEKAKKEAFKKWLKERGDIQCEEEGIELFSLFYDNIIDVVLGVAEKEVNRLNKVIVIADTELTKRKKEIEQQKSKISELELSLKRLKKMNEEMIQNLKDYKIIHDRLLAEKKEQQEVIKNQADIIYKLGQSVKTTNFEFKAREKK